MITLGLHFGHEAGVALVDGMGILFAANEERYNRVKGYAGFPEKCLAEAFRHTGIKPSEVEHVVIAGKNQAWEDFILGDFKTKGFQAVDFFERLGLLKYMFGTVWGIEVCNALYRAAPNKRWEGFEELIRRGFGISAPISFHDHHTAHAYSAYYTGAKDRALVVTVDGAGDGYCSRVFLGQDGAMTPFFQIPEFHSIGFYYLYVTYLCGFIPGRHEGKITGLAAAGDPAATKKIFEAEIRYDPSRRSFFNQGRFFRHETERLKKLLKGFSREDIAAGIQAHLEELVTAYLKTMIADAGIHDLVLAGGVFANVRLNQRVAEIDGVESVFIHPNMGDGGIPLGAALGHNAELMNKAGAKARPFRLKDVYLGSEYSDKAIEEELRRNPFPFHKSPEVEREIAEQLASGKVVARVAGRMEYGPRALANRSILCHGTDPSINDWLNDRLKRSEFMPFAPILLREDAGKYLKGYGEKTAYPAEFMTITYDTTERCRKEAPATVHIDGTARPQVVEERINPSMAKVLQEYKKRSGLSVLINTSFNMHEEPIVCSPSDALRAFSQGHLDVLALGDFIAVNPSAQPKPRPARSVSRAV